MYVTDEMIEEMAEAYGTPARRNFDIPTSDKEHDFIRSTQKNGRNHDVTLYVRKGDKFIVNAKHFYPPGLYRAPSGGLQPGEDFHAGIAREMAEEIGCEITIDRFLLYNSVAFRKDDGDAIAWRSFVFLGDFLSGDFDFTDEYEIREVNLAKWEDFDRFCELMRAQNRAGFTYRIALHQAVAELI
jgi:8-oxo-dGTP pyrophosphatase MutT (NUDIX family)